MKPFHFKEFTIHQEHSALKVGTDAMLLGAFAEANNPKHILDIGTGTGVVALMTAQKFQDATVLAIDIDTESLIDCQRNFEASPWNNRLISKEQDILLMDENQSFDLIISNPPFYEQSLKSNDERMNNAKHASKDLIEGIFFKVRKLMSLKGEFWIILPSYSFPYWKAIAAELGLYIQQEIAIESKQDLSIRVIASFSKEYLPTIIPQSFVLRNADNSYSEEYIILTKDFHQKKL